MDIREVFVRNLRRVRHENDYTQEALALEAGVDRTYISALERGVYSASIDMVDKLAGVLGVETDTLLHRPAKAGRKKPYRLAPIPARSLLKPATSASKKVHATVRRRG
jgi:transcriptional regulator with XRE-family HTH domain